MTMLYAEYIILKLVLILLYINVVVTGLSDTVPRYDNNNNNNACK